MTIKEFLLFFNGKEKRFIKKAIKQEIKRQKEQEKREMREFYSDLRCISHKIRG